MEQTLVTKAEFSRLKGWNKSTATRYAAAGKIVVTADGLVDVEASERRLAELADATKEGVRQRHERERMRRDTLRGAHADLPAGRQPASGEAGDRDDTKPDPSDSSYLQLQKHRAESEAHRAALLRMEREEKEGRLVDAEAVRRRAFDAARGARNAILNLPHRIDPLLAGEVDAAKRLAIWERELRQVLSELARSMSVPADEPDRALAG